MEWIIILTNYTNNNSSTNIVVGVITKNPYKFIEVLACPGGCLNGGG